MYTLVWLLRREDKYWEGQNTSVKVSASQRPITEKSCPGVQPSTFPLQAPCCTLQCSFSRSAEGDKPLGMLNLVVLQKSQLLPDVVSPAQECWHLQFFICAKSSFHLELEFGLANQRKQVLKMQTFFGGQVAGLAYSAYQASWRAAIGSFRVTQLERQNTAWLCTTLG